MIIGIAGAIGSGKTTLANYLVSQGFVIFSMADCLKRACQEIFLLSDQQIYGTQEDKAEADPRWYNCSPRTMLQFIGTDLLRNNLDKIMPGLGNDVFVHHFKLWYKQQLATNPDIRIVIADVRFPNEVNAIRELGGRVIKIDREEIVDNIHESENALKGIEYDIVIENNGTLEELYSKIGNII